MSGHATKPGVFSILEKPEIPSLQHLQRSAYALDRIGSHGSGTALHAGIVPGYPASHGCIRLPLAFAPKLYSITRVGDNVVVAGNQTAPELLEHPNLFQLSPFGPRLRRSVHRLGVMQMAMRSPTRRLCVSWSRAAPSAIASSPCSTSFRRWAFSRRRIFPGDLGQRRSLPLRRSKMQTVCLKVDDPQAQLAKKVYEVPEQKSLPKGAFS